MKRIESIPPEGRDQDPTTFAEILQHLLWLEPRATAAVLIDSEGETVDYASSLSGYYTKVAAANLRVVLDDMVGAWSKIGPLLPSPASKSSPVTSRPPPVTGGAEEFALAHALVRAHHRTFFVRPLPDGYALVVILRRRAFQVSPRALALTVCRLSKEAGWPSPPEETLPWHPAEVESRRADRFRPVQVKAGETWERLEVLGSIVGLARDREKGYRCRLHGGAEITLVRESTGIWFADQPARGLSSRLGPESQPPPPVSPGQESRNSRSPADAARRSRRPA